MSVDPNFVQEVFAAAKREGKAVEGTKKDGTSFWGIPKSATGGPYWHIVGPKGQATISINEVEELSKVDG